MHGKAKSTKNISFFLKNLVVTGENANFAPVRGVRGPHERLLIFLITYRSEKMIDKNIVKNIVDEWLSGKEYFLTDLTVSADDRIVVEIDHKDGVWIDDCVELSKFIEERLSRDQEDYELEVGSAGIGQPFKVKQQYVNHVGDPVEALTLDGRKLKGVLKAAGDDGFTLTVQTKVKPEGAKRPKLVDEDVTMGYGDVKSVKYLIKF